MQVNKSIERGARHARPLRLRVVKRYGRFLLLRKGKWFLWVMRSEAGVCWYWHPETEQWTGRPRGSLSPGEAMAGLDLAAPPDESRSHAHEPNPSTPPGPHRRDNPSHAPTAQALRWRLPS